MEGEPCELDAFERADYSQFPVAACLDVGDSEDIFDFVLEVANVFECDLVEQSVEVFVRFFAESYFVDVFAGGYDGLFDFESGLVDEHGGVWG